MPPRFENLPISSTLCCWPPAPISRDRLNLDGLPPGTGIEGLRFLKHYNDDQPLAIQGDVLVIGGGFTAVDCAARRGDCSVRRPGVTIVYRRGEAQMAASPEELEQLREENVRVETLATPLAARAEGGQLRGRRLPPQRAARGRPAGPEARLRSRSP